MEKHISHTLRIGYKKEADPCAPFAILSDLSAVIFYSHTSILVTHTGLVTYEVLNTTVHFWVFQQSQFHADAIESEEDENYPFLVRDLIKHMDESHTKMLELQCLFNPAA